MRFRVLLILLVVPILAGCVSHGDIANSAVDFNRAVERAQNQMLLLNAIRASERRPMYITGVQTVTGSVTTEASAGIEFPFGTAAGENKGMPSISYSDNPTFEVPVFETKEFMLGFLSPIKPDSLAYYWNQGWPRSLLFHLLVERIHVKGKAKDPDTNQTLKVDVVFDNDPDVGDELCQFVRYGRFVDMFLEVGKPVIEANENEENVEGIPLLFREELGGLKTLLAARKEGLRLHYDNANPGVFQLQEVSKEFVFKVGPKVLNRIGLRSLKITEDMPCGQQPRQGDQDREGKMTVETIGEDKEDAAGSPEAKNPISIDLTLRSPEAVLYYLGELIRAEQSGKVPSLRTSEGWEPIFVAIKPGFSCTGGIVEARYENKFYMIPRRKDRPAPPPPAPQAKKAYALAPVEDIIADLKCDGGRSMQSLSLVSQLIALQKSAEDLPSSNVVRTIGD